MEFRVEPTPLSRRRGRRILATTALIVAALVVIIGAITLAGAGQDAVVGSTAATPIAPTSIASAMPPPSSTAVARTGPEPRVVCHDVASAPCTAIAQAALTAADDPALPWPTQVDVWASLLCGSDFDCPPDRMTGHRAAGSAVVTAGSVELWVNVVAPSAERGPQSLEAWVIRSGPIG